MEQPNNYYFPPYITLAHLFNAPQGWAIENRILKQYVLQYVVDGVAEYPVENNHYVTKRGDLLFHRPNELHSIVTLEGQPYVCISIVFHFGNSSFPIDDLINNVHYLGNFTNHPVERKLSELIIQYKQPGLIPTLQCQSLLMQILTEGSQWRNEQNAKTDSQQKNHAKLILIKNYITDHYTEDIQHTDLEKISGLSRNYIISQFKKMFGMSPMQFLMWIRINKAKNLAVQSNLSIGEIADRVGYSDVHTFGKMFKKKTGSSLTQFCAALFPHDKNNA